VSKRADNHPDANTLFLRFLCNTLSHSRLRKINKQQCLSRFAEEPLWPCGRARSAWRNRLFHGTKQPFPQRGAISSVVLPHPYTQAKKAIQWRHDVRFKCEQIYIPYQYTSFAQYHNVSYDIWHAFCCKAATRLTTHTDIQTAQPFFWFKFLEDIFLRLHFCIIIQKRAHFQTRISRQTSILI